jgi:hypothetical protein
MSLILAPAPGAVQIAGPVYPLDHEGEVRLVFGCSQADTDVLGLFLCR